MNYCEKDELHVIKIIAKVCLREMKISIGLEMATFYLEFLYMQ